MSALGKYGKCLDLVVQYLAISQIRDHWDIFNQQRYYQIITLKTDVPEIQQNVFQEMIQSFKFNISKNKKGTEIHNTK